MSMKDLGPTQGTYLKLHYSRYAGEDGTHGGAVKCVDILWNADGEDSLLGIF